MINTCIFCNRKRILKSSLLENLTEFSFNICILQFNYFKYISDHYNNLSSLLKSPSEIIIFIEKH